MKNNYLKIISITILFIIILSNLCFAEEITLPVWSQNSLQETSVVSNNIEVTDLQLESKAAILMEASTGEILYEYNSHEQLRPASVTKVMTILLIMEALDSGQITLEDKVPCSQNARKMGGSQIWLAENEELTVHEMLKAICVVSANDCTVAMAEYLAGSQEAFVAKMNQRAKELGMNDTNFVNAHGIDEDGHVTSAHDIALMSRELTTKHPKIFEYTTIWMDTLRDGKSELVNTNKLIRNYKGATGLKTGSTSLALYNLSATATRDDLSLIGVIMGAPTTKVRFSEATKLLDYGFSKYSAKKICSKSEIIKEISVIKGVKEKVSVAYNDDLYTIIKKGEDKNIEQSVDLSETIIAPVNVGDKIGEVNYTLDGKKLGTIDIICTEKIDKLTLSNMIKLTFDSWFKLLR